jgi:hypothetical protein
MITKFKLFENNNDDNYRSFRNLDLEILENGDLKIILNDDGREEMDDYNEINEEKFYDLFEYVTANSEYLFFKDLGDAGFALTSMPGILDGYYHDDDGTITDAGHEDTSIIYTYPYYVTKDFMQELDKNGYVIFETDKPRTKEEIKEYRLKKTMNKYNI